MTLSLLWEEYCAKCQETGQKPYMSTQFGERYRRWARITGATMRIQHKPGDAMQVDWAGDTIPIQDPVTGEQSAAYLFVAVLPCSYYTYAEACDDMKTENWLNCHVHAFDYFGGVARLLIPDNCKTATLSNTRYDVILNRSYQELAEHYGTAIVPARVRKPKDKSSAEASVRFAETWIVAALRDRKFFSLQELNEAVAEKQDELNSRPFKQMAGCRRSTYLEEEKPYMLPLPASAFEPAVWSVAKVANDYLVTDGRNKYSVPYNLIGERVDIRVTKTTVEVFYHGSRVASHRRLQATMDMLTAMKMSAMAAEFANQLKDPAFNELGFEERLGLLVNAEWNRRQCNKLDRFIRNAHFAVSSATVEGIEYHEDRKLDKAQILRFATCKYIDEGHHIILKGASGNGKTYIACALGNAACRRFKKVQYIRMPELLDELSIARSGGTLKKVLESYKKKYLLILDEWLIRPLSPQESYDMLEIVEARCQKSMIFCTQYQSEGWYTRIDPNPESDSPVSEAIMDRIIHNAYEVLVDGRVSMRERKGLKATAREGGGQNV